MKQINKREQCLAYLDRESTDFGSSTVRSILLTRVEERHNGGNKKKTVIERFKKGINPYAV